MNDSYDLIVIGSGTAAQVASTRARAAGWTVAVIDHRPFGGTCALRGCDPKKMLISGAEGVDGVRRMRGHGVEGDVRIEWPELIAFKRTFTDPVPAKQEARYAHLGIDAFHGFARFVGPNSLAVDGKVRTGRHILIATGARPAPLGIPGEEHVVFSDQFLEMETLPRRIALIGGGYIAAEFSHIAARAGAHITILQRNPRLLPAFDPDLVSWLMAKFDELNIDARTETAVEAVEAIPDGGYRVQARAGNADASVEADLVVHAAGRVPALDALDVAAAGISVKKGRLVLNEFLQSVSNPAVYAAGDAAGVGPPLTPVSSHDAKIVAANLLEGAARHRPDYRGVPSVAFTIPPIAAVGLSEAAARERFPKVRVKSESVPDWYTARRLAEKVYGYKTLVDEDTGTIVGAHLVGPHVDEVINILGLAIRSGLTVDDLKSTIFAYPTGASDIGYML
jgi:glutathione reductase (NADPH)